MVKNNFALIILIAKLLKNCSNSATIHSTIRSVIMKTQENPVNLLVQ